MLDVISAYNFSRSAGAFGVPALKSASQTLHKSMQAKSALGYVSDNPANNTQAQAEFYLTQYALAPAIIKASTEEPLVVANFHTNQPDQALLSGQASHAGPRFRQRRVHLPQYHTMTLLYLALVWLMGCGLVRWMFPAPLRPSLHNALLVSLGAGAGIGIASSLYFLALAFVGPGIPVLAAVEGVALLAALALAILVKRRGTAARMGAVAACSLVSQRSVGDRRSGRSDHVSLLRAHQAAWRMGRLVHLEPAGALFISRRPALARRLLESDLAWSHPDYPLMLPGIVAMCWSLARAESTLAPTLVAFLFTFGAAAHLDFHARDSARQNASADRGSSAAGQRVHDHERGQPVRGYPDRLLHARGARLVVPSGTLSGRSALQHPGGVNGRLCGLDQERRIAIPGGRDRGSRLGAHSIR